MPDGSAEQSGKAREAAKMDRLEGEALEGVEGHGSYESEGGDVSQPGVLASPPSQHQEGIARLFLTP